jgi:hypothetical protein
MTKEELVFTKIGITLKDAVRGRMFGKTCFKINRKAFICFFGNEMVFKLNGDAYTNALKLPGSRQFDPSGKKPMKEWVQVPFEHSDKWHQLAEASLDYINQITNKIQV